MLLDDCHLGAVLGCGKSCLGTGMATAHDNDVELLGLGDIGCGNFGSLAEPVFVAHIVDYGHRVHGFGGICGRGATLGARGLVVGQGDRGGGHAGNGGAGGCDERTTGEFHVARSLSSRVLMRSHVSVLTATALRTRAAQSDGRRWFQNASATRRIAFRWAFKYGRTHGQISQRFSTRKPLTALSCQNETVIATMMVVRVLDIKRQGLGRRRSAHHAV